MNAEFFDALDALEKTKGIPKEYMLERVEAALAPPTRESAEETTCASLLIPRKRILRFTPGRR